MTALVVKTKDAETISEYYSGDFSQMPIIPRVGDFISGPFGEGEVFKVEHHVDLEGEKKVYTIFLHFTAINKTYEHTGF
jgi:hypothetical protein